MRASPPSSRAGFTLVEMTVAAALMAIILTAAYLCLNAGLSAQRLIDPRLEAMQTARVALSLITADLRGACPLSADNEFIGMRRTLGSVEVGNLDFATHHYTPSRPGEGDYCQTSYFVDVDPKDGALVLWRRRNPRIGLDPLSGGSREEIARGIRQLKFEFYDGFTWYDTWGDPNADGRDKRRTSDRTQYNLSGMPEAVRITLGLAPSGRRPSQAATDAAARADAATTAGEEPPMLFQTVARLIVPILPSGDSPDASGDSGPTPGTTPSVNPVPSGRKS